MHILRPMEKQGRRRAARERGAALLQQTPASPRGLFAPSPLPRLDKRTYLDINTPRAAIHAIMHDYGQGEVEVGWARVSGRPSRHGEKGRGSAPEENEQRAVRRAKAQVRRKCMAGDLSYLLTLTYREIVEQARAWGDFEAFVRLLHRYKSDWPYVVVVELQERGAPHFHLAVRGFQDVELIRWCWRQVVGEGNIDVQAPPERGGGQWKRSVLARYLTKYVTKEMTAHESGKHRYRASLGITVPTEREFYPMTGQVPSSLPLAWLGSRSALPIVLMFEDEEKRWGYCRTFS